MRYDHTADGASRRAFKTVPETCDDVRAALDRAGQEIQAYYEIPDWDHAAVDAAISRAFCEIRERATVPLRQALITTMREKANG